MENKSINLKCFNGEDIEQMKQNVEKVLTKFYNDIIENDKDYLKKEEIVFTNFNRISESGFFSTAFCDLFFKVINDYTELLINKFSEYIAINLLKNFV